MTYKLAVLASGGGTTMQAIFNAIRSGELPDIEPALLIVNKKDAGAQAKALAWGLPSQRIIYLPRQRKSPEEYGAELLVLLRLYGVDIVGQYGWLALTPKNVVNAYAGRMINQHPGPLDPDYLDFGGQGMHGLAVHAAVLEFNRLVGGRLGFTEASAQLVHPQFDKGALLGTRRMKIEAGDTPESLQARLLPLEYDLQIDVLRRFAETGVLEPLPPRSPRLILPGEEEFLAEARRVR